MSDWPIGLRQGIRYSALSPHSPGQPCGESIAGASATTAAAWPAANRVILLPVTVTRNVVITKLGVYNGAVAGNVACGFYTVTPANGLILLRVANTGSVAMSGANVLQSFDVEDVEVAAGLCYIGFTCSTTTTATFRRSEPGLAAVQAAGIVQYSAAGTEAPEQVALPERPASNYVPILTATTKSVY